MQIHITLHGAMRVVAGRSVVDLAFDDSSVTLDKTLEALIAAHPRVRPYLLDAGGDLRPALRVLLNNERLDLAARPLPMLHDNDRLTLLTPVAGGAPSSSGL
jgi:molybdopterin converting factor small subunit